MLKTFTLHTISHQQQTAENGLITWEVLDEQRSAISLATYFRLAAPRPLAIA